MAGIVIPSRYAVWSATKFPTCLKVNLSIAVMGDGIECRSLMGIPVQSDDRTLLMRTCPHSNGSIGSSIFSFAK